MDDKIKEILNSINNRFPAGRHSSRIILMLNGEVSYDKDEVMRDLQGIIEVGGSDRRYTTDNDKKDAAFFFQQLKDFHEADEKF